MNESAVVCRCEEITLETIASTAKKFQCSSREVKLRTRAGMGYCGGRTCRSMVEQIVREINNEKAGDEIQLSYRPPVRPVTFGQLEGEDVHES